jgi:hypothetical protein
MIPGILLQVIQLATKGLGPAIAVIHSGPSIAHKFSIHKPSLGVYQGNRSAIAISVHGLDLNRLFADQGLGLFSSFVTCCFRDA